MLDIKFIRDNPEVVKRALKSRNSKINIDELLSLDEKRRKLLVETETLKAERNKANDEISAAIKAKKNPKELIDKMKVVSQKVADLDKKVGEVDQKQTNLLYITNWSIFGQLPPLFCLNRLLFGKLLSFGRLSLSGSSWPS